MKNSQGRPPCASCCPYSDGGRGELPAPAASATSVSQCFQQSAFPVIGPANDLSCGGGATDGVDCSCCCFEKIIEKDLIFKNSCTF